MSSSLALSLPHHIWSRIIDQARIHYEHTATYQSEMDYLGKAKRRGKRLASRFHVLARCSLVCKRFASLCLEWRLEFIRLESKASFTFFSDLLHRDSLALDPLQLGSMVKELRFYAFDNLETERSEEQVPNLCLLLPNLPSLRHLGVAPAVSSLSSLIPSLTLLQDHLPPLESLVGLKVSPETLPSFLHLLQLLQPSLESLDFTIIDGDPNLTQLPKHLLSLTLPFLHTLALSDSADAPSQSLLDFLAQWNLPKLRRVAFTLYTDHLNPPLNLSTFFLQHGSRIESFAWDPYHRKETYPFIPHLHLLPSLSSLACPPFDADDHQLDALHNIQDFILILESYDGETWGGDEGVERFLNAVGRERLKGLKRVGWQGGGDEEGADWKIVLRWLGRLKKDGVSVAWSGS